MDEVEQIKRRIDVVELISTYLTLKKSGANYKALCPFHQEKTPSFMVSPEKQIWHCFGCSEGGDIFTFVMKMENLEFPEALRMLAERTGVKLKPKSSFTKTAEDKPDRKSRLYELNSLAARAFHKILTSHPSGKAALGYLKKRKLTDATIKEFMLGYAPSSRAMNAILKKQGFTDQEIQKAGSPDKFYRRIIFPIRDIMGNTIAFTGRVVDPQQEPKYLNTPETIIFYKSRVLYNSDKARGAIKTQKAAVVVEGQMDVIASHQAGVQNVVATSGTALTREHLEILSRYSPNIIFAFDSDTAGLASAKKAYEMAIIQGMNVKMVDLGNPPAGGFKDPGEMIAQSPKLWREAVQNAISVIDWYFQLAFSKQLTTDNQELTSQEKKEIAREILPLLRKIPDTIEQAHYVGLLAKRLGVSETVIFDALKKIQSKASSKPVAAVPVRKKLSSEELFLGILLKRPDRLKEVQKQIKSSEFQSPELSAIYSKMCKLYNKSGLSLQSNQEQIKFLVQLKKGLNRQLKFKVDDLLLIVESQDIAQNLEDDLAITAKNLKIRQREDLKNYYAQEIKKAENAKDLTRLKKLIKEFQDAISG